MFGPKRDEVLGGWRKLRNEELHNLYFPSDIIRIFKLRRMRWAEHVSCLGEMRNVYIILVGKPEGKRPLGRPRHRWEDNFKMNLTEIGCERVEWIPMAQDKDRWRAPVNTVMNFRVRKSWGIS
jgi:hypothetical protein